MKWRNGALACVTLVAAWPGWSQTTTGRLIGTVVDEEGLPLPGARVTISSPALIGGVQAKQSDQQGNFVFLSLAPGDYRVRVEQAGFVTQERRAVVVPLGGAAAIGIALPRAVFSGEIEVVYETPVVDPTQVNAGQVFDQPYMQNSAIGSANRDYLVIVNQAAGVAGGGSWEGFAQPRVFGSTIGENAYFIDGMDTTNPTMATATGALNFDAVGEIQFQTGGFEAEYGRATGGIINVVTKSGGNSFSGTLDARYRNQSFQEGGDQFDTSQLDTSFQRYGFTLGGPVVRDRVWFFGSYQWTDDEFTPIDSPTTNIVEGENHLAKITWQITDSWRFTGRYSADPMDEENWNASRWVMPDATAVATSATTVVAGELNSVLSESLLWHATLGWYEYEYERYPQSGDLQTIGHYNLTTGFSTRSYGHQQYWSSPRYDLTTDLTWFVDDLAGSHEIKAGIEYSDTAHAEEGFCLTGSPNGERCAEGVPGFLFYDIELQETLPFLMLEDYGFSDAEYTGSVSTVFVQDAWRITRNLTLKTGLRYDVVTCDDNEATEVADMDKIQPRLGLAWDLTGDAKNVLRANWGRFLHPAALALPAWASTQQGASSYWYSCSGAVPLYLGISVSSPEECAAAAADLGFPYRLDNEGWDPYGWMLPPWEIYGSEPPRVAPDLRATYADELILAFEREVGNRSSIELSYVDKKTRDIFDDTCNGNVPIPSADAECDYFVFANVPGLARDYRGFIVRFESRGLHWLTLLASYTYSKSEGSVEYSQYVSNIVDIYPWQFDNIYGYLSDHRTHRLKLNGFITPGGDWTIAFDGYWTSPFTWTPYENRIDNPEIPSGAHFLEPRGNREANDQYQLDLQLSKGFAIGPVRTVLIGSIYNVLSNEQPTSVCSHISGCGNIVMGEPTNWQTPRRYELGFRVEF